jgi:hypothetical protein
MALASAMGNAMQGLQFMTKQRAESDQSDQAQANWEKQFGLARDSAALARQKVAQEDWRQIQANDIANKYVGLQERMLKLQESGQNAAGVRAQEDRNRTILSMGDQGLPGIPGNQEPEDYLTTLFPDAPKGIIASAAGSAKERWRQQQDLYDRASSTADTLNNYDDLNARVAEAKKKVATFGLLGRNVTDKAAYQAAQQELDHLTASQETMAQFVPRLQKQIQDPKHPLSSLIAAPINAGEPWNVVIHPPRRNPYAQQPGDMDYTWGPDESVDTSGDNAGEMTPVPRQAPAASMPATAPRVSVAPPPTPPAPTGVRQVAPVAARKFDPWIYDRVNQIVSQNPSIDPIMATRRAIQEYGMRQSVRMLP